MTLIYTKYSRKHTANLIFKNINSWLKLILITDFVCPNDWSSVSDYAQPLSQSQRRISASAALQSRAAETERKREVSLMMSSERNRCLMLFLKLRALIFEKMKSSYVVLRICLGAKLDRCVWDKRHNQELRTPHYTYFPVLSLISLYPFDIYSYSPVFSHSGYRGCFYQNSATHCVNVWHNLNQLISIENTC